MAHFRCRVADPDGSIRIEVVEAKNLEDVARRFGQSGTILVAVELDESLNTGKKSYSDKTMLEFTKALAVLLQAGLPLEGALEIAEESFEGHKAQPLARWLRERISKGESFSSSLEASGARLSPVYRGLVRIGERTGQLEPMFIKVSAYLEEQKRLKDKIGGALVYPALVMSLVIAMLIGIAFFLVPGLRSLFGSMGTELPPRTMLALRTLSLLSWVISGLFVFGVCGFVILRYLRRKQGDAATILDRALLSIPVLGRYLVLSESLSFSFAMETLVSSGIGLEDAVLEGTGVLKNRAMITDLENARQGILEGLALSTALGRCRSMPKEFSRWATIGERTGVVEGIFVQTRAYFQYEIEKWTMRFMNLIEPILIVSVGVILITLIVLFIMPFLTSFTALI